MRSLTWAMESEIRGEFCLIIEGGQWSEDESEEAWWIDLDIVGHVNHYIETKEFTSKDAIKQVAKDRNMQKRDVYQACHIDIQ